MTAERLRIDWREHDTVIAVSRLFDDGTLLREQGNDVRIERRHGPDAMSALDASVERAGLFSADHAFCKRKPTMK